MNIVFAIILGILLLSTLKALLRVLGMSFAGDREKRTCANCGVENIEHLATAPSPHWLLWTATSEHIARCGLPCANGLKLSREEYLTSLSAIHRGGACSRCGDTSHDRR